METLASRHDCLLLDLDGTVFRGHAPTPGAVQTLESVESRTLVVTNNASRSADAVAAHLCALGFTATAAPGSPVLGSDELEEARWFTRESIAAGEVLLPPSTSISHRLIAEWFDAGWARPLGEVTAGRPWGWRSR